VNKVLKLEAQPRPRSVRTPLNSPLTPRLREFIDRAIVPALVRSYLATDEAKIDLAHDESDAAHSDSSTGPK
jgi:hypothetical protein